MAGACSSSVSVPAGGVGECVFVGDNAPTPAPQGEAGECANDDGTGFVPVGSRKCVKSLYGSDDSVEVSDFYSLVLIPIINVIKIVSRNVLIWTVQLCGVEWRNALECVIQAALALALQRVWKRRTRRWWSILIVLVAMLDGLFSFF